MYNQEAPEVLARETWMTELPPELQHIGLGARTFKKRSGPENKDRSIWTDTPADRERKDRVTNYNLHIYVRISALLPYFFIALFSNFRNAVRVRTKVKQRKMKPLNSPVKTWTWQRKSPSIM